MQASVTRTNHPSAAESASVSPDEIRRFDALAARWWDPSGPMRPLHQMNPARIGWITERLRRRFPDPSSVRLLDLGCGAGLAAEALARAGFQVTGIDAAGEAIKAAEAHAAGQDLPLAYRTATAEQLVAEGQRFHAVSALEVIEHVPDPAAFLATIARLIEPNGMLFLSTLNRTPRSFVMAKLGAEYVLRLLPVGTHDWRKFIRPSELAADLRRAGFRLSDSAGLIADPIAGRWRIGRDLSVNYIVEAQAA